MKPSSLLYGAIWTFILVDAFQQGRGVPTSPTAHTLGQNDSGLLILVLPFAFFVTAAFMQRPQLFNFPFIAKLVDAKFGDGAFTRILTGLRPTALFTVACFTLGGTGLISTYSTNKLIGAYVLSGFFVSGGLGLLAAYLLSIKFPPRII